MLLLKSTLCLAAALSAHAFDLPSWAQPAIDSGLALGGLNGIALLKSMSKFQGACNPATLKIRQEWYVFGSLGTLCGATTHMMLTDHKGEPSL